MYTYSLDQVLQFDSLHKWPGNDMIHVRLLRTMAVPDGANMSDYEVAVSLSAVSALAKPGHRWWKGLEISTAATYGPSTVDCELWTQDDRLGDISKDYLAPTIANGGFFILKKAKLFGVHTGMYRVDHQHRCNTVGPMGKDRKSGSGSASRATGDQDHRLRLGLGWARGPTHEAV